MNYLANIAFALSAFSWATLRIVRLPTDDRWTLVNLCIAALHLQVGVLFLLRRPVTRMPSLKALVIAFGSLILAGLVLKMAPRVGQWPPWAAMVFCFATIWIIVSFSFLGRSFAVLPLFRDLVSRGPYALIRHPAYLGEMVLISVAVLVAMDWRAFVCWLAALIAVMARIRVEEEVLVADPSYNRYREQVKYRLLPWVW